MALISGGGGGGSIPVYSWLGAYLAAPLVNPAGGTPLAWDSPADALVGTDLSISVDGKTITFLTTGSYVVSVYLSATSGAPPKELNLNPSFTTTVTNGFWNVANTAAFLTVPGVNGLSLPLTYPPAKLAAGDTMQVVAGAAAVTVTASTTLWVTRVA